VEGKGKVTCDGDFCLKKIEKKKKKKGRETPLGERRKWKEGDAGGYPCEPVSKEKGGKKKGEQEELSEKKKRKGVGSLCPDRLRNGEGGEIDPGPQG